MNTSATTPLTRSIKHLCAASAAAVLVFGAATAKADFTIYSQNFDSPLIDGLTADAGRGDIYYWPGTGNVSNATFSGGKLTISGSTDLLLGFGSDLFSHGTNHIKIEYDLTSYQQLDNLFAPGDAAAPDFVYNATAGFQHGSGLLYAYSGSGFDYGSQPSVSNPITKHWTFDFVKSGTDVTWYATYDADTLFVGGGTKTYSVNTPAFAAVGLNTMEIFALGGAGTTLDNIVVTGVVPEPASALLLVAGGVSLLARRRREVQK